MEKDLHVGAKNTGSKDPADGELAALEAHRDDSNRWSLDGVTVFVRCPCRKRRRFGGYYEARNQNLVLDCAISSALPAHVPIRAAREQLALLAITVTCAG